MRDDSPWVLVVLDVAATVVADTLDSAEVVAVASGVVASAAAVVVVLGALRDHQACQHYVCR